NRFRISAVLDRKTEHDRGVACVRIGRTVALVVVEKQLADSAVGESAHRRSVAQASDRELEALAQPSVGQALAAHPAPSGGVLNTKSGILSGSGGGASSLSSAKPARAISLPHTVQPGTGLRP